MDILQQENLVSLWNQVTSAFTKTTGQPIMILGVFVLVLVGTNLLGNLLATPLGIGIILGVVGSMYVYANYIQPKKNQKKS